MPLLAQVIGNVIGSGHEMELPNGVAYGTPLRMLSELDLELEQIDIRYLACSLDDDKKVSD